MLNPEPLIGWLRIAPMNDGGNVQWRDSSGSIKLGEFIFSGLFPSAAAASRTASFIVWKRVELTFDHDLWQS